MFQITAYGSDCIGCSGTTACGTTPQINRTVAVDPEVIPIGSEVMIDDQIYIAEDTGGAIKGNKIDIFMNSESQCNNWGKRTIDIYIVE